MFLALDTSTLTLSLALAHGRAEAVRVIEEVTLGPPEKQSELLPGAIGALLARHELALERLEGIAVGLGPGSFTGLRIGMASAKALAWASGVRLVGVPSFRALALEGPEERPLFICTVARTQELYVACYRRRGLSLERLAAEEALSFRELAARVFATSGALVLGPAIAAVRPALLEAGLPEPSLFAGAAWPRAGLLARLVEFPPSQTQSELFAMEPMYVRASEAERNPKFPPLPGPVPGARLKED